MVEITNPSSVLLLTEREDNPPGSVIVASLEGTRPRFLVGDSSTNSYNCFLVCREELQMELIIIE